MGILLSFSICSAVTWCAHVQNTISTILALGELRCWKRFVSSHYPLSGVSIWGGRLPRVLEAVGGQKVLGQNALALGSVRSPQAVHLCADSTSLPKSDCDLAAIGLACLFFFFFFKRSLYRCCFSPKPRVGAVIVMPRNSRPGSSLAQNSYRARGRLGIPLGTDLWVLWWWMGVEERRYSRSPVGWGDQLPSFCRESVWGS